MPEPGIKVTLPGAVAYDDAPCYLSPLTLFDVKELNNAIVKDDLALLVKVVNRRCSLDVRELIYPDFMFCLHWLKHESYTKFKTTFRWTCGQCGKEHDAKFVVGNFASLKDDYRHGLKLSLSVGPTAIRLPLMRDVLALHAKREKGADPVENDVERIARMFEPAGGDVAGRVELVKNLSADDETAIAVFEADYAYGVSDLQRVTCAKCGNEEEVRTEQSVTRFLSSDDIPDALRDRIYHGSGVPSEPPGPPE